MFGNELGGGGPELKPAAAASHESRLPKLCGMIDGPSGRLDINRFGPNATDKSFDARLAGFIEDGPKGCDEVGE